MLIKFIPATKKQLDYIDILVIDLSYTREQRKFYLTRIAGRPISTPDELSKTEASKVISTFIEWKENKEAEDQRIYEQYDIDKNYDGNFEPADGLDHSD